MGLPVLPATEKPKSFRVVIVGSSVAGLTLGHCLHNAGIDFIILEKHNDIEKEVGATIGIGANGAMVLDQLGVQEGVEENSCRREEIEFRWGLKAKRLAGIDDLLRLVIKRTGYALYATTRHELITVLFQRFPQRDKILTNHAVTNIDLFQNGVKVHCANGTSFQGDLVVGADGIHSKIRQEMWRHASIMSPSAFAPRDKVIPAEYCLLFGLSTPIPGLSHEPDQSVVNKNFCFLTIPCSRGRFGWFIFAKLDKRYEVPNLPRYSQKDADDFAQPYMDYSITEEVLFRDVWKHRIVAGLAPQEEYLADRWTFDRIACVGDAIRKTAPTSGQSGNNAMEDCAELTNALHHLVKAGANEHPDTASLEQSLQKFNKIRHPRAKVFHEESQFILRNECLNTKFDEFAARYIIPNVPDILVNHLSDTAIGSTRLDFLPLGSRVHRGNMYRPRPEPMRNRALRAAPVLLVCVWLWLYYLNGKFFQMIADKRSAQTYEGVTEGALVASPWGYKFPSNSLMYWLPLPRMLSAELETMVEFYMSMLTNELARARGLAFWLEFNATLGIFMAESRRRGNAFSFASIASLFVWIVKFRGAGSGIPLYVFLHYLQNPITNYRAQDLRHIPTNSAKALLPAILIGFTLPTAYMFLSAPSTGFITAWQFFPMIVPILQMAIAYFIPLSPTAFVDKPHADLPYIRAFYAVCAAASTMAYWYAATGFSLSSIYYALPFGTGHGTFATLGAFWASQLPVDMLTERISMVYLIALNFRDMKAIGRLATAWTPLVLAFITIAAVLSPGTAMIAAWAYREELLAKPWEVPVQPRKSVVY